MRLVAVLIFTFSAYCVNGQILSLDDIFNIRTMDSTELATFCLHKCFKLIVNESNLTSSRSYYTPVDMSIWFTIIFPKDSIFDKSIYYHFIDSKIADEFKNQIKSKGFKLKRTKTKRDRGNKFTHSIFLIRDNEIHLLSRKLIGEEITNYTLLCQKRLTKSTAANNVYAQINLNFINNFLR